MWKIECHRKWYKPWTYYRPWEYELILSSHGMIWGQAWTKRGAEMRLIKQQSEWFAER